MKRICILVGCLWVLLGASQTVPQEPIEMFTVRTNGPHANRINLAIFGDGFSAAEQDKLRVQSTNFAGYIIDQPPFKDYAALWNVYSFTIVSKESGSDQPVKGIYRDTYLSSTFDSYGTPRLLTIPPNDRDGSSANGTRRVQLLLAHWLPSYDAVLIMCNDSRYGGAGGSFLTSSLEKSAPEIARHEMGHSFAGLGDEYSTAYPYPDIEEPNTTRETNRNAIKWKAWILASTPVPTPNSSTYSKLVGLFEGAHYHPKGWYRPWYDCKMRTLGKPFCPVCSEQLLIRMYAKLSIFDATYPVQTNLTVAGSVELAVLPIIPEQFLHVEWMLNGQPLGEDDTVLELGLPAGQHTVVCTVTDTNSVFLAENRPKASRTWFVTSTQSGGQPPTAPALRVVPGRP